MSRLFEMSVTNEPTVRKWVFTGANSTYLVGSFDGYRFRPETKPVKWIVVQTIMRFKHIVMHQMTEEYK